MRERDKSFVICLVYSKATNVSKYCFLAYTSENRKDAIQRQVVLSYLILD
jgi:hypothetical protein